jgi:hypothetical protein
LFSGRKAGSAGSESLGSTDIAGAKVDVVLAELEESLPESSNAGTAISVITAASTRRRRSVKVSISVFRL